MSAECLDRDCADESPSLGFDTDPWTPAADLHDGGIDAASVAPVADPLLSRADRGLCTVDGSGATSSPKPAAGDASASSDASGSSTAAAEADDPEPCASPRFGPLVLHEGFTLMNSQVLRSGVFQSPPLGRWLRALGDDSRYRLRVDGFSPGAQHQLLLLFAISRMRGAPDVRRGAAVRFTTRQLIDGLGWARNVHSYARAERLIDELRRVRLGFRVEDPVRAQAVVCDGPLFDCETPGRRKGEVLFWQATLTPALLALFALDRNTLLELRACRVLHAAGAALWLYGLIASQAAQMPKTFDAGVLCRASGLAAARDADKRKALVQALTALQRGSALARSGRGQQPQTAYTPILAEWSLRKGERGWQVTLTRSSAFRGTPAPQRPGRAS